MRYSRDYLMAGFSFYMRPLYLLAETLNRDSGLLGGIGSVWNRAAKMAQRPQITSRTTPMRRQMALDVTARVQARAKALTEKLINTTVRTHPGRS